MNATPYLPHSAERENAISRGDAGDAGDAVVFFGARLDDWSNSPRNIFGERPAR